MGMDKKLNRAYTEGFNQGFLICREITKNVFRDTKGIGPNKQAVLMKEFERQLAVKWVELNGTG
jgi:hypothetical protein